MDLNMPYNNGILNFYNFMIKTSFEICKYDNYVYFKLNNISSPIYLLLNVDDMLIACKAKYEYQAWILLELNQDCFCLNNPMSKKF